MVIPWIVGAAIVVLGLRWWFVFARAAADNRSFGAAIKNRHDVKRYLGDNQ